MFALDLTQVVSSSILFCKAQDTTHVRLNFHGIGWDDTEFSPLLCTPLWVFYPLSSFVDLVCNILHGLQSFSLNPLPFVIILRKIREINATYHSQTQVIDLLIKTK